jgi:hypothetical protein
MTIEAIAAVATVLLSIGALVVAARASRLAGTANTIGVRANALAEESNRLARRAVEIAEQSSEISGASNTIAERAADEARRSADAAEASLTLQRDERAAADAERQSGALARIEPITWDTRARAGELQGMQFKNFGRAAARDFQGVFVHGGLLSVRRAAIGVNELVAFRGGYFAWEGAIEEPPAFEGERQVAARAFWINEDGSPGDSGWKVIPRT